MNMQQTVSLVHQNVSSWHYDKAFQAWDTYSHCLDDKGLYHPDFVNTVKFSLSDYSRHISIADSLMKKITPEPELFRSNPPLNNFEYEFEQAVAARGRDAKAEFERNRR